VNPLQTLEVLHLAQGLEALPGTPEVVAEIWHVGGEFWIYVRMWRVEDLGLPVSWPRRDMKVFWRVSVRLSCLRKKTTPLSETGECMLGVW
jgi:hypothetical protein